MHSVNVQLVFSDFSTTLTEVTCAALSLSCLEKEPYRLHITSYFDQGIFGHKSSDYVSLSAVQEALGSVTTLTVIAWTITPRALTARVKLSPSQLKLWRNLDSGASGEKGHNFRFKVNAYEFVSCFPNSPFPIEITLSLVCFRCKVEFQSCTN